MVEKDLLNTALLEADDCSRISPPNIDVAEPKIAQNPKTNAGIFYSKGSVYVSC